MISCYLIRYLIENHFDKLEFVNQTIFSPKIILGIVVKHLFQRL